LATLNQSYQLRYAEYTKMVIIVVVSLALILGLNMAASRFPVIPQGIVTLLSVVIVTIATILCVYISVKVYSRNNMNFNEINVTTPTATDASNTTMIDTTTVNSTLLTAPSFCFGAQCCSGNDISWNGVACVLSSGFTTITDIRKPTTFSIQPTPEVGPFEPNDNFQYLS